jgi:2-polyprenyl-3-methyl-5-hydroxy-6-metoxy-1,4-benzoquinol methylase
LEKEKWDKEYSSAVADKDAAALLVENRHLLSGGTALDVAMGMGQNALFLASCGYAVDGIDISAVAITHVREMAISTHLPVHAIEADLAQYPVPENRYDLIINFYFLERNLIPHIKTGLKQGGMIFFETFTVAQRQFGRPSNPDYLLQPNELLLSFADFFILFYHERIVRDAQGSRAIASLIAQKV